jgi:hypothetical protein
MTGGSSCQPGAKRGEGGLRRGRFPRIEAEIGQGSTGLWAYWADAEWRRRGKEWSNAEGLVRLGQNPRRVL